MKELQIKFFSKILAILLLVTRVKSKKICKPGQEDVTSQPFDLTARSECEIFLWNFSIYPTKGLSGQNYTQIENLNNLSKVMQQKRTIHLKWSIKYTERRKRNVIQIRRSLLGSILSAQILFSDINKY
jgi:hypothetical protein